MHAALRTTPASHWWYISLLANTRKNHHPSRARHQARIKFAQRQQKQRLQEKNLSSRHELGRSGERVVDLYCGVERADDTSGLGRWVWATLHELPKEHGKGMTYRGVGQMVVQVGDGALAGHDGLQEDPCVVQGQIQTSDQCATKGLLRQDMLTTHKHRMHCIAVVQICGTRDQYLVYQQVRHQLQSAAFSWQEHPPARRSRSKRTWPGGRS
jgi:hypothetical protein